MMTEIRTINNIETDLIISEAPRTSPFALYPEETLKYYTANNPCYVYLTDLDKLILVVLNKYHILTSSLLTKALLNLGLENAEQKDIQHRLRLLAEGNFVTKGAFVSPTGKSAASIFMLAHRGRGFLRSIGQDVRLSGYLSSIDHIQCKKILSVNQFLIATNTAYDTISGCAPVISPGKTDGLVFRPQATVSADRTIFVEAVRSNDTDFTAIDEKLERMEKTLRRRNLNISVAEPQVILVCESTQMMKNLMRHLRGAKFSFSVLFTSDILSFDSPECCLCRLESKRSFWDILTGKAALF